jgi:transcriptional regulator with XRE-family HTH domain
MAQTRPLADLLRELREAQGRSLRGAARDLGVDAAYLSRVERGKQSASRDVVSRAAVYYGVPQERLDAARGDVPADIADILGQHPELIDELRARYGSS